MKRNIPKSLPSQDELRRLFDYDAETGKLIWRYRPESDFPTKRGWLVFNSCRAGKALKATTSRGYPRVRICGKMYYIHRVVWVWNVGEIADDLQVDHIDGNRLNNKISNLRPVTNSQNSRNRAMNTNNTSGINGVFWHKLRNRWMVMPTINGKKKHLGFFIDKEKAAEVAAAFYSANGFTNRHIGKITA